MSHFLFEKNCCYLLYISRPFRQSFNQLDGFQTDGDDLANQFDDVLRVVWAVGVVGDAASIVGFDLVLIDNPIQSRAIAQAVVKRFWWDASQGEKIIVADLSLVFGEFHLLDAPIKGRTGFFY